MGRADVDVAIIGAGLAGLAAARSLSRSGTSVRVLEARERVGGRLLNAPIGAGQVVEVGGQWVGPGQDRVLALIAELGLQTFPTFEEGRAVLELDGDRRLYSGTIPRVGPLVLADIALSRWRLERLARRVGTAPWTTPDAEDLDSVTLADWLERHMRTGKARTMLRLAGRTVWGAEPEDMSLLHALFYIRSAGGLDPLIDVEGGAQQDRIAGGSQLITTSMAAELGASVELGTPVTAIEQEAEGVVVRAASGDVSAQRAIVAIPPALRTEIEFDPALPDPHGELGALVPFGRLVKCVAVYDRPFWRDRGLNGEGLSDRGIVSLTFDNSPPAGSPGVLLGFVGGADAHRAGELPPERRRDLVLADLARLFGEPAGDPDRYLELDWGAERWSGGGPTFVMPPGAWNRVGPALRGTVGRIHWAGTETATRWAGFMDGAVTSGERAAAEAAAELRNSG
jgi:monoamine oxidase